TGNQQVVGRRLREVSGPVSRCRRDDLVDLTEEANFLNTRVVPISECVVICPVAGGQQRLVLVGPRQFKPSGMPRHGALMSLSSPTRGSTSPSSHLTYAGEHPTDR